MTSGSQQFGDDYEQLQSDLELYPKITITATEGQPPDSYEIEYALKGYTKEADGSITVSRLHRIQISLPFGYPHFAPTVKPLTHIFHPDVDPAAIRIAGQWQQNPSLADLILHIGEMISGKVYSLTDPFNQEAADWYQQHQHELPLDALSIVDLEESPRDIDSLVDDTFAALGLETDDFLEPAKEVDPGDIAQIQTLVQEQRLSTASQALADLPASAQQPEQKGLQESVDRGLQKAEQLYSLAQQLEDLGKLDEALEVMDNLYALTSDYPGSEELLSRLQQAHALVPGAKGQAPSQETAPPAKKKAATTPAPAKAAAGRAKKKSRPSLHFNIPLKFISIVAILLAVCIGVLSLYFKDQNILSRSQANLLKSQLLIDKKQFDRAQESLLSAQNILSRLTVLRFRKAKLEEEIAGQLSSQELQQGLQGRVLYQGKYIPLSSAKAMRELEILMEQGRYLKDKNKPAEALVIFRQGLQYADDHGLSEKMVELDGVIKGLELQQTLALAEQAELGKNWQEAAETYRQALELSGSLSDPQTASTITSRLTAASFRHEFDQSKQSFTQAEWQQTIQKLQHAQKLINTTPEVVSAKERQDLHRLLVNAQLYGTLSAAREAYGQKDWDLAIAKYRDSLDLLNRQGDNFGGSLKESVKKIRKTMLMVQIAKTQEQVLLAEGNDNPLGALEHRRQIRQLIRTSPFGTDPEVVDVDQRVGQQIVGLEEELSRKRQIEWLEEHFEQIFRENYPTFKGSELLAPKARVLRTLDDSTIFTITCVEKSQGTSSRLELNYRYDPATESWSVHTGQ
ncbi:ubiquitin-conjugating enzyme E2 [Desulfogranum mediterraneum]|uniref:ubiquitin-conjugating enzyme E2 n=1 Tax=Desulfogranum mediterraneum TaxID=160661 RepID=UPI000427BF21|nr:ubiquitin-conjugating enzyme E2 [Desulfogranum mediterraneum]